MGLGLLGAALIVWGVMGGRRRRSGVMIKHRTLRLRAHKGRLVQCDVIESEREL